MRDKKRRLSRAKEDIAGYFILAGVVLGFSWNEFRTDWSIVLATSFLVGLLGGQLCTACFEIHAARGKRVWWIVGLALNPFAGFLAFFLISTDIAVGYVLGASITFTLSSGFVEIIRLLKRDESRTR